MQARSLFARRGRLSRRRECRTLSNDGRGRAFRRGLLADSLVEFESVLSVGLSGAEQRRLVPIAGVVWRTAGGGGLRRLDG